MRVETPQVAGSPPQASVSGTTPGTFALSRMEMRAGAIGFVLALLARFPALLPGYSIDDYYFVNLGLPSPLDPMAIMNGRALGYVVYAALARLGAAPPRAGVLYIVLLTAALVATGIAACRLWQLSDRMFPSVIVIGFIALHPYQAEMFTFRTASMVAALPTLLAMAAILLCTKSRMYWLASVLLLTCAICIYQVVLSYLAIMIVFSLAFRFADSKDAFRANLPAAGKQVGLVAMSVVLYLASTILVSRVTGVALGSRTSIIGFSDLGNRAWVSAGAVFRLAFGDEAVLPLTVKLLMILIFATGFVACMIAAVQGGPGEQRRLAALILAAVAGAPLCLGIGVALREFSVTPRVISQTSVYVAGLMAMVYVFARARLRPVLPAGMVLVFFSFLGMNEQILTDQLRVNLRDMAEANRILMRIELLPGFREFKTVVVSGGSPHYAASIRTAQDDMNVSALFADWSKVGLLNEATGYAFSEPTPDQKIRGRAMCKERPKWPAPESIGAMGTAAVVCLPED